MDKMRCVWLFGFIFTSSIIIFLMVPTPAASEWKEYWGDPGNVNSPDGTGELSQGQVRYKYANETLWLPPLICDVSDDAYPEIIRFHRPIKGTHPARKWIEVIDHRNEVLKFKIFMRYNQEYVPSFGVANPGTSNAIIYCMDSDGVLYLYAGRDGSLVHTVNIPDSGGSRGFFKAFDTDGDGFEEIFGVTELFLFRVDTRTGELLWVAEDWIYRMPFAFGTYYDQSVIVARLYLKDGNGQQNDTAIISTSNGKVLHVFRSDISVLTRVVVTDIDFDGNDEFIYVSNAKTLRAIDLLTMDVDWSINISSPSTDILFAVHVDTEGERSWLVTSHNTSLYDGSNGSLLDTYLGKHQTHLIGHFDGRTDGLDTVIFDPGTKKVQILFDHERIWDVFKLASSPDMVNWGIPFVYTCDIDLDGDEEVVFNYGTGSMVGYAIIDSGRESGYEIEIEPGEDAMIKVLVERDSFKLNANLSVKPDGRLPVRTTFGLSFDGLELHYVYDLHTDDVHTVSADFSEDLYRLDRTVTVSEKLGFINITLTFQAMWGWAETRPASVDFVLSEHGGYIHTVAFEDVFYVEPDVYVIGPVQLHTSESKLEIAYDSTTMVRNLTVLSVSGLRVYHEDGPLLTVLPTGWYVSLKVDEAVFAIPPTSRFSDDISFPFPNHDAHGPLRVEIGLTSLPNGTRCVSTLVFYLTVDQEPPSFESLFPENGTWFSESMVTIGVQVRDNGFGLNGGEVQLQITPSRYLWVEVPIEPAGENTWYCNQVVTLSEGWNEITWRAMDAGGNGYVYSDRTMVGVDLESISFELSNPVKWINNTDHTFLVHIRDEGGSGIQLPSLEYRYSNDGLFNFTPWTSLNVQGVEIEYDASIQVVLAEGWAQNLQLKGHDIAGNVAHSVPLRFNVDMSPPNMGIIEPDLSEVLNGNVVEFIWHLHDSISGLPTDAFEYRYKRDGGWSHWNKVTLSKNDNLWIASFELSFIEGRRNHLETRCIDIAGNLARSETINILINSAPIVIISSPKNGKEFVAGLEILFDSIGSVDIDEGDVLVYTWFSDRDGILSTQPGFSTTNLSIGTHSITLFIADPAGHNESFIITISVVKNQTVAETNNTYYLLMVFLVLVIIMIFLMEYKKRENLQNI